MFKHLETHQERSESVELLAEFIYKQTGLQNLELQRNNFSSNATLAIMTRLADFGRNSKLEALNLMGSVNFFTYETAEKLADVL